MPLPSASIFTDVMFLAAVLHRISLGKPEYQLSSEEFVKLNRAAFIPPPPPKECELLEQCLDCVTTAITSRRLYDDRKDVSCQTQ